MPEVFTVFNCGTAFNREKDELVADLFRRARGAENRDKLITEGPGSAPSGPQAQSVAKTPGSVRWDLGRGIGRSRGTFARAARIAGGLAKGDGWEQNVEWFMNVIDAIRQGSGLPAVVNMAGWSRGAVTCHMMAHALHDEYGESVKVHVFAIDPVPGPGNFNDLRRISIPPNVRAYTAILAADEARTQMKPTLVTPPPRCAADFIVMPGSHSTMVKAGTALNHVALVTRHLAEEFLSTHGTDFEGQGSRLPLPQLLESYALIQMARRGYREKGKAGRTWKALALLSGEDRTLDRRLATGVDAGKDFFVNAHHETVFQNLFPRTHRLLFARTLGPGALSRGEAGMIDAELSRLENASPNTRVLMARLGVAA